MGKFVPPRGCKRGKILPRRVNMMVMGPVPCGDSLNLHATLFS
jgi:hypothetical protein